jgi:hypothetical protein
MNKVFGAIPRTVIVAAFWVLLAALMSLGFWLKSSENKSTSQQSASDQERQCRTEKAQKIAEFKRLLELGEPWKAALEIRICAGVLKDPEMLAMVRQGELQDRLITAKNARATPFERMSAIEQIEEMDPQRGLELKALKAEVNKAVEREREKLARELAAEKRKKGVTIGMTKEDVLASNWGKPKSVNSSTYSFGVREQWVYGNGHYLYFKNGVLDSIQTRN